VLEYQRNTLRGADFHVSLVRESVQDGEDEVQPEVKHPSFRFKRSPDDKLDDTRPQLSDQNEKICRRISNRLASNLVGESCWMEGRWADNIPERKEASSHTIAERFPYPRRRGLYHILRRIGRSGRRRLSVSQLHPFRHRSSKVKLESVGLTIISKSQFVSLPHHLPELMIMLASDDHRSSLLHHEWIWSVFNRSLDKVGELGV